MNTAQEILARLLVRYPALASCECEIRQAFERLADCFSGGGKLLLCGNGGSAADCGHIVGELMKGFLLPRPLTGQEQEAFSAADGGDLAEGLQRGLPAISLVDMAALNSAFCNDISHDLLFAQSTYVLGNRGDVLLAISTSGQSMNIVNAIKTAKVRGLTTIGLTGEGGGAMADLCDVCICAPARETFCVQEYHLPIYHALCAMLEVHFFGE